MIQTKFNTVYVCEIRFSKQAIGTAIIEEVKQKIGRLKLPRHTTYRPVLIHAGDITKDLANNQYFANCVNLEQFINPI